MVQQQVQETTTEGGRLPLKTTEWRCEGGLLRAQLLRRIYSQSHQRNILSWSLLVSK